MDASRLAAMSSRKSVETTASPEGLTVSRDIGQWPPICGPGLIRVVVRLKARAGMGAPSPAHATSFAGIPCRRGMWIELIPASEVCRPAFISLAAALCGARELMKSPTAFRASSAAQPVVVVVAGLVVARVRRSGVTSSLGQSRCATSSERRQSLSLRIVEWRAWRPQRRRARSGLQGAHVSRPVAGMVVDVKPMLAGGLMQLFKHETVT